jgi:hypothetical protein
MNFDHVPSNIFWPVFLLVWFIVAMAVTWAFGKLVDRMNPRSNRGAYRHMASVDRVRKQGRS